MQPHPERDPLFPGQPASWSHHPWTTLTLSWCGSLAMLYRSCLQLSDPNRHSTCNRILLRIGAFTLLSQAEGSAVHWQARVHYYWYRKIKSQCEAKGACQMGGFTRLLHSGKPDDLMDEIPSYVVNPLPPDKQDHKGYVVLNRPYAFAQWTQQVTIKEKYVIMSEPDHVWLKPMPNLMKV